MRPQDPGPHPAVIVIHEIWGLDAHIEDVARRLADLGYVALAPHLYTGDLAVAMTPDNIRAGMMLLRNAPPDIQREPSRLSAHLATFSPAQRKALTTLIRVMSPQVREELTQDLASAVAFFQTLPDVQSDRIGSLGFCMGGSLSANLATLSPTLAACVIFYGDAPPADRIANIPCPVLGLYGGEDHRITDQVPAFANAMAEAKKSFTYHVYPGARHAFFNDSRQATYDPSAAADAWHRVQTFLSHTLRS